jgi:DNA/RNA endonuclease G (NUC1)
MLMTPSSGIVISQVYGGGGNSGATYKNDFIELHNIGATPVSLNGWSVQYAASGGTSWQKTDLTGTLQPGLYYLVQEGAGSGGTTALPTPNASGGIAMSATAGKVALVSNNTLLTGSCPLGAPVVDFVGFGTAANCAEGSPTPTLSNTTAALRGNADTDNNAADFTVGAPNPRNSPPDNTVILGPYDHVAISGNSGTLNKGASVDVKALLQDAQNQTIPDPNATYTWTTDDANTVAFTSGTTAATATIKGLAVGGPVAITVTAASNGVSKTATLNVTVATAPSNISITVEAGLPLVIGYESRVFANGTDDSGNPVSTGNVTWTTSDASVIKIVDQGVIGAAGPGTATLTATAADGSAKTFSITTEVPFYNNNARLGHNVEFGTPTDADPSNDVLISREEYALSYNPQRGGPNWVSWDLSASDIGTRDRCNCFSSDTALVRLGYGQFMYNGNSYVNSGYDRGHVQPSADATTTDGENARVFFMTNMLPQQHNLNAGPWEKLEIALRDSAKAGREVYVIAGGYYENGTGLGSIRNEGKILIPNSTWKIAVLMPAGKGLGDVSSASDINVIAVDMPNISNPSSDWTTYKTTVDRIQKETGYDFLAALPDPIECKVESSDCAPTAHVTGAGVNGGLEGQTLSFDGSTSSDPDAGDALSYQWSVNGQTVSIQPSLSYTFADNGTYVVRLIVADQAGKGDTSSVNVTIANVAPTATLSATSSLSIQSGQSVSIGGSFTDPGADAPWQYVLSWGDGAPQSGTFANSGAAVTASHRYLAAGQYTVTFTVADKDGASSVRTLTVNVGRVAVDGEANPGNIKLNDNGNGNISIRLTSSNVDVSTIDVSSVRIGSVSAERGNVDQGGRRLSLDFSRKALIDAGALTSSTTELVLTATLADGRQIVSHIAVSTH